MSHKLNKSVWCWVGGWVYLLHQKDLDRARELGIKWIRPASEEEVKSTLATLKQASPVKLAALRQSPPTTSGA